ncbi:hypothetical protein I4U23_002164 [Adineta vaga]|nr:hypothetical protein I4U23_002164 [Adineta vaga]
MDVKYIGGDEPWTLPFGDHFNSSNEPYKSNLISSSELEIIARRHGFEPLYSASEKQSQPKFPFTNDNLQWMNTGILFTDKTIEPNMSGTHYTDFSDNHGHTFCYLCSINQHHHEHTKPRDQSRRRKLIPYNNPKALRVQSASKDRPISASSTTNSTSYRFIVRTGTRENSGTRAQVFLYMYGTENDWTSINLRARAKQTCDGFPSGSIRTFCLKGPDIGQLHHLNVNLVGARSDKEWYLNEIEITNLNTSKTWLCEFNCWLPKTDNTEPQYHVKPTNELTSDNLCVYILQIRTGGKAFAGTDSTIQVTVKGSKSQTRQLTLTSSQANLFEQNQLDTFAIAGWDLGDLLEITVKSDRTQTAADWDLKEMAMWKILPDNDHKQFQVYFPFNTWLGKKVSTLEAKREKYPITDQHIRGPTCYHIIVKTGDTRGAGTDANVFIIIYGESGRTVIHHLDNIGKNDFERKSSSEFTIMDIDVGDINRIKIWHDNTKPGAGWFLDTVIIRKKHSTCRPISNSFIQRVTQISKVLYREAREQMKKNYNVRSSSLKENDPRSSDRKSTSLKRVTFDKDSIGSQDERFDYDTQRQKNKQTSIDSKRHKDQLSNESISGHFDHRATWISSHTFTNNRWQIKSIEEQKSFNIDQSVRSSLLSDRLAIDSKIKTSTHDRDDDVYEFTANRWLAKDEHDGKLEVSLSPKAKQLSTDTKNESKSTTDTTTDLNKHKLRPTSSSSVDIPNDDQNTKRSSQRSSGALSQLKESFLDKYQRPLSPSQTTKSPRDKTERTVPSASEKDLPAKSSGQSTYGSQSAVKSLIDRTSSDFRTQHSPSPRFDQRANSPVSGNRDLPPRTSAEPSSVLKSANERDSRTKLSGQSTYGSQSAVKSLIDRTSSDLRNQHSPSPRFDQRISSPLPSNRDLAPRTSAESSFVPSTNERDSRGKLSGQSTHGSQSAIKSLIDRTSSDFRTQHSPSPSRFDQRASSPVPSNRDLAPRTSAEPSSVLKSTNERDSRTKLSGQSTHGSQSAIKSLIDKTSSDLRNQHSPSPRLDQRISSPVPSIRDLAPRTSAEPLSVLKSSNERDSRTKLSGQSTHGSQSSDLRNQHSPSPRFDQRVSSPAPINRDLPPHRSTRNQVYSSAYGTIPSDNF